MKIYTKPEAIELHREMWDRMNVFLKDVRNRLKSDLSNIGEIYDKLGGGITWIKLAVLSDPEFINKSEFDPDEAVGDPKEGLLNLCFLCHYTQLQNNDSCENCPLEWNEGRLCTSSTGEYHDFSSNAALLGMYLRRMVHENNMVSITYNAIIVPLDHMIELSSIIANLPVKGEQHEKESNKN